MEKGIGRKGVVGIIKGRKGDGNEIGIREEMDEIKIKEKRGEE